MVSGRKEGKKRAHITTRACHGQQRWTGPVSTHMGRVVSLHTYTHTHTKTHQMLPQGRRAPSRLAEEEEEAEGYRVEPDQGLGLFFLFFFVFFVWGWWRLYWCVTIKTHTYIYNTPDPRTEKGEGKNSGCSWSLIAPLLLPAASVEEDSSCCCGEAAAACRNRRAFTAIVAAPAFFFRGFGFGGDCGLVI